MQAPCPREPRDRPDPVAPGVRRPWRAIQWTALAALLLLPAALRLSFRGDALDMTLVALQVLALAVAVLGARWLVASHDRARNLQAALDDLQARGNTAESELAQANARAEGAERESRAAQTDRDAARADRTRFLAAASHDLRQPIHAIGLFVGALKEELRDGRARQLVDRLDRSMSGIDELFDRLLDMSRLDAGTIEIRMSVFTLAPLLQTLSTRFAPVAEQRGLRLRVRLPRAAHVRSDAALLIEMLMNLLSNAFRHTSAGGILVGARRRGERILIQVWDTGCGIAPADQERIFGEFVQLDNAPRNRRPGLGLGLAIVRRLGALLDCPVTVRSRPGHGSVFSISVPAGAPGAVARTPEAQADDDTAVLEGMLILVVDDDLDILIGMEALLAGWGCFVIVARTLDEARRHLIDAERFPDALVTDHRLGAGNTSTDVVGLVTELVPVRVPVVVLSAEAGGGLKHIAADKGWSLLAKPVSPRRLKALLAELVSRRDA